MFVSADLNSNYLLIPGNQEFRPFYRLFAHQIINAAQGYTLASYDLVPDSVVIGAEYFEHVATKTRSYDTKQATLTGLQRVINLGDNNIINASKGIRMPLAATINKTPLGMVINHIPQLFAIYEGKVLTAFNGHYNFKTNLFRGQCDFQTVGEIWKG